jgi:hypothetical protein
MFGRTPPSLTPAHAARSAILSARLVRAPRCSLRRFLLRHRAHPPTPLCLAAASPPQRCAHPLRPPPRCLLAHLHRVAFSPRLPLLSWKASTTDAAASRQGERDSCDAAPTDELPMRLSHSEVHAPPSTSAPACLHLSKQSPCCRTMFQVVGYKNKGYPQSTIKKNKTSGTSRDSERNASTTSRLVRGSLDGTPRPRSDSYETRSTRCLDYREISDSHDPGSGRLTHLIHQL